MNYCEANYSFALVERHTSGFESPATASVKIKSSKVVLDRATNEDNNNF